MSRIEFSELGFIDRLKLVTAAGIEASEEVFLCTAGISTRRGEKSKLEKVMKCIRLSELDEEIRKDIYSFMIDIEIRDRENRRIFYGLMDSAKREDLWVEVGVEENEREPLIKGIVYRYELAAKNIHSSE